MNETICEITNGNGNQPRVNINNKSRKMFLCIGTSLMDWAVNDVPFVEPLCSLEDFDNNGFDEEDYNKSCDLQVGESWQTDFPNEGVFIMRVQ